MFKQTLELQKADKDQTYTAVNAVVHNDGQYKPEEIEFHLLLNSLRGIFKKAGFKEGEKLGTSLYQ